MLPFPLRSSKAGSLTTLASWYRWYDGYAITRHSAMGTRWVTLGFPVWVCNVSLRHTLGCWRKCQQDLTGDGDILLRQILLMCRPYRRDKWIPQGGLISSPCVEISVHHLIFSYILILALPCPCMWLFPFVSSGLPLLVLQPCTWPVLSS